MLCDHLSSPEGQVEFHTQGGAREDEIERNLTISRDLSELIEKDECLSVEKAAKDLASTEEPKIDFDKLVEELDTLMLLLENEEFPTANEGRYLCDQPETCLQPVAADTDTPTTDHPWSLLPATAKDEDSDFPNSNEWLECFIEVMGDVTESASDFLTPIHRLPEPKSL